LNLIAEAFIFSEYVVLEFGWEVQPWHAVFYCEPSEVVIRFGLVVADTIACFVLCFRVFPDVEYGGEGIARVSTF
jgi:hypothetical protein